MADILLGGKTYPGINRVRLDTPEGDTVDFTPYEETFAAGQKSEYDRFWDEYQKTGNYIGAFAGYGWNANTIKPKKDIKPTNALSMFFYNQMGGDLVAFFENLGIALDFSINKNANNLFQYSKFTRVGKIYSDADTWYTTFGGCKQLVTIDEFGRYDDGEIRGGLASAFTDCTALVNIKVKGIIAGNASFKWSPMLSDASVQSIIDHLKDLTGAATQTLTFHAEVGAKLTEEQKAAMTAKNWTLVY
jgi:hypothetical protein